MVESLKITPNIRSKSQIPVGMAWAKACRHSGLQCSSVDAMECHGEALALSDAIEVGYTILC